MTSGALPAAPAPGPLQWALIVLAVISFGLVAVVQAMFPLWAYHPAAAGLRVHLSNGFYANAVFDRLLRGSVRATQPVCREPKMTQSETLNRLDPIELEAAANRAARAIPPAWPLASSVAVNPFLGQTHESLATVGARLARVAGRHDHHAPTLAPGADRERRDHRPPICRRPWPARRRRYAQRLSPRSSPPPKLRNPQRGALPTIADLAAEVSGIDWPGLIAERFGAWAAGTSTRARRSGPRLAAEAPTPLGALSRPMI